MIGNTYWVCTLFPQYILYQPAIGFFLNISLIISLFSLKLMVPKLSQSTKLWKCPTQLPYKIRSFTSFLISLPTTFPFVCSLIPWLPPCCSTNWPAFPRLKTFPFAIPYAWNALPPDICMACVSSPFLSFLSVLHPSVLLERPYFTYKIELHPSYTALLFSTALKPSKVLAHYLSPFIRRQAPREQIFACFIHRPTSNM